MTVHFDAAEVVPLDRLADERQHAAGVADRMDEREAVQPAARGADDARDPPVGDGVVRMERREHHRALDPRARRAGEVAAEARLGVPRPRQAVAETGVAVAVDDHRDVSLQDARPAGTVLAGLLG